MTLRCFVLASLLLSAGPGCDGTPSDPAPESGKPSKPGPSGVALPLGQEVLMVKGVVHVVEGTAITVINRGRGMTIEMDGGHEIFATLDVEQDGTRTSLDLSGWDAQEFAGYSFAITGIGEKHGGTDVEIRVTKP